MYLYKKLVIILSTIVLSFAFVTYQPKQVDAYVNVAAKIAAKQTIKAVTKSAVDDTIQKMLVKDLLDEVAEGYAKKNGYKLIESGGQKLLMKQTFTTAEKKTLKNKIDDIIEQKIYGNAPGWVKFVDWFIGAGAVMMAGQLLMAYLSGDLQQFLAEIINEALVSLGWLEPAVPKNINVADPVGFDRVTSHPRYDYSGTAPSLNDLQMSQTYQYDVSGNFEGNLIFPLYLPTSQFMDGSILYTEVVPLSSQGLDDIPRFTTVTSGTSTYFNGSFIFSSSLNVKVSPGTLSAYVGGRLDNTRTLASQTTIGNSDVLKSTSFDPRNYNRLIFQHMSFDPNTRLYVSRLIYQDTYLRQYPDVYLQLVHPEGTNFRNDITSNLRFNITGYDSALMFPYKVKVGYYRDVNLALSTDMLPQPKLVTTDITVPVINADKRIPIPQNTILPPGYTYVPEEQVIKDPSGQIVENPETIDLPNPDPVIEYTPEDETIIDGTPTGVPKPPPIEGSEPDPPGGIEGGTPSEIEWEKLKAIPTLFTMKFPFSLPWDAKRFMEGVFGDIPQASEFAVDIDELMGINFDLHIRLPDYFDNLFDFSRTATVILFDLGLIYGLYRLLGGAS